jgi:hypothetical protein
LLSSAAALLFIFMMMPAGNEEPESHEEQIRLPSLLLYGRRAARLPHYTELRAVIFDAGR